MTTYTITVSHSSGRLDALRSEWQALHSRSSRQSIYLTWEWITNWWKHFNTEGELWLLEARTPDQELVGLAPLMLVDAQPIPGISWKELQFVGASGYFDHLGFIIKAGAEQAVIPALLDKLIRLCDGWDVLNLTSIAEDDPALDVLLAQDIDWRKEEATICPAIDLPNSWDEFHSSLSKRKRRNLRRAHHKLDEGFPNNWRIEQITLPQDVDSVMVKMIEMHQAKWAALGKPGGFADPRTAAFHRSNAQFLAEGGHLWLFRLWIGNIVAVIEYAFAWDRRVYAFSSGLNFDLQEYSPG